MLLIGRESRSKRNLNSLSDIKVPMFDLANFEDSDDEVEQSTKCVPLQNLYIQRYHQEFRELGLIGTGKFGSVYKCINRLDSRIYAIKKSIKLIAGSINEKNALNEVSAHAILRHQHVVQYFSAWMEDNRIIIQKEYCNGGSLVDWIPYLQKQNEYFWERALQLLLLHVAEGLKYMHSMQLVHLDIKPGSIFISQRKCLVLYNSADNNIVVEEIIYKIGSLGHVTSINNPQVETDNCRYLPTEILSKDFTHLPKADIFALGLTVYEAAGGGPFPKDESAWHEIRQGKLKQLANYSYDFNDLLKLMIHPNPAMRPSAETLIQNQVLCPLENKIKAHLQQELNMTKQKNEILLNLLQQTEKCSKTIAPNVTVMNNTMNAGVTNYDRHLPEHNPVLWAERSIVVKVLQTSFSFIISNLPLIYNISCYIIIFLYLFLHLSPTDGLFYIYLLWNT